MSIMNRSNEQMRDAIAEQAADWFVQNRDGPPGRETRAGFVAWLRASPLHIEEYLGIAAVARDVAVAADGPEFHPQALLQRARAAADNVVALERPQVRPAVGSSPAHRIQRWPRIAAAAAVLIAVGVTAVWWTRDGERFGLPRTYTTAHGEQRVQQLPDGSVLHLNTDSQITVRYSRRERVVYVDRGQALFQVTHEGRRTFRVAAGHAEVVAVGTEFDVYRKSGSVMVTVVEGTVAVFAGPPPEPTALLPPDAVRVGAGYQIEVGSRIGAPKRVDARQAVAWLHRQIAFENWALGEVAAEFNRYGPIPLEIDDQALRALPISGVFDAYDTDSFAAFLEKLSGVVVQKTPTRIRVLSLASSREPLAVTR
jgi:transmembrane sensor